MKKLNEVESNKAQVKIPPVVALGTALISGAVTILTTCAKGHAVESAVYDSEGNPVFNGDGSLATVVSCEGFWGRCKLPSTTISGTSVSLYPDEISEDEIDFTAEALIAVTEDEKVIYAINYAENPQSADNFFYDGVIDVTGKLKIDNPEVLSELELDPDHPIIMHGEYQVYHDEDQSLLFVVLKQL